MTENMQKECVYIYFLSAKTNLSIVYICLSLQGFLGGAGAESMGKKWSKHWMGQAKYHEKAHSFKGLEIWGF